MQKKMIALAVFAGCLGGALTLGMSKLFEAPSTATSQSQIIMTTPVDQAPALQVNIPSYMASGPESAVSFTGAAEKSVHSVVHITSESTVEYETYDPFLEFFGGSGNRTQSQQAVSSGSGVIVSADGYIITNNHVVENADRLSIVLNDKRRYDAKVIGTDPSTDLALLKIEANDLPHISYGNSDNVMVGEWVLAVGNPFNLNSTVTAGIVSAKGRNINLLEYDADKEIFPLESFIQTDAAVNPGNSGGALVNTNGDLVGINTAIASRTGSYAGYSFAIPVNIVKKVTNDLLEYGAVQRAFIGVSIRDLDQGLANDLGVSDIIGVYVNDLTSGGAAYEAGIRKGDILTQVGSIQVKNVPELQEQVARYRPGDQISVTLTRGGETKVYEVTLRNKNGDTKIVTPPLSAKNTTIFGAVLEKAPATDLEALELDYGVKVGDLEGGKLLAAGVKEGFIITHIDKVNMRTPEQVETALAQKSGGILIEGVYPNGKKAYYGFGR
jgi:serine protease Do